MQFLSNTNIDFLKHRKKAFCVSAVMAVVAVISLVLHKGPNFSIDFTGGTLLQGFFENPVPLENLRKVLNESELGGAELQSVPAHNAFIIRYKEGAAKEKDELATDMTNILTKAFPDNPFTLERAEFVGPVIGRHLIKKAVLAIMFSLCGIIVYVAFRFKNWIWGISGVLALAHDVFLAIGFLSVINREISISVIAALLTLAGYSINDTIVIFDRIRENIRSRRKEPLDVLINRSLNETLSRTVITSLTTFMVLLCLLFFGGEVIRDFSIALTFGVALGTYSTLFVATPVVYVWQMSRLKKR